MTTLNRADIETDARAYAARRSGERERAMARRKLRRVQLGDQLALEFENAQTLTYQVQEMVFAEGLTDPAEVGHELETYARLLPNSHRLTATLLVELEDVSTVRDELAVLAGVHQAITLSIGDRTLPGVEIPGPDEDEPSDTTYSVHFLAFTLDDETRDAFRDPAVPAALMVEHPAYSETTPITAETRKSLISDLALPA